MFIIETYKHIVLLCHQHRVIRRIKKELDNS